MTNKFLPQKLLTFVAVVALLIAYYWVHKPTSIATFLVLGGTLLDFVIVAAVASIGGGLGRRALIRLDLSPLSIPERVALEGALGLGAVSLGALALGLVGLFNSIVFAVLLLAASILVGQSIRAWLVDLMLTLELALHPKSAWARFLAVVVLLLLAIALLHAFAPPTAWDAMTYHLVGPKRYLAESRILAYSDNHFMGFPQNIEMLYSVMMSFFGRDTTAAPLHFWFGFIGLMAIAGLVRRYADSTAALIAVFLLVTSYSLWVLFGWPYIDLAILAYSALALSAATLWYETKHPAWLAVMGLCGGLALGVKYTAGGLILALAVFVLVREPKRWFKNGLLLGGVAALAFGLWALKGLLLYQNPVYPYIFNGLNWDASRTMIFNLSGYGLLNSPDVWQLPILPLSATIFGVEKAGRFTFTGSPWLLTAPILFLIPGWRYLDQRAKALARDCFLFVPPILAFWMFLAATNYIGGQVRLMMIGLPAVAVLGGLGFYGLSKWPKQPLDLYFIVRALVAFTTLLTVVDIVVETSSQRQFDYFAGTITREQYLARNLGLYYDAMQRLEDLPPDSDVLFMWEPKWYACPATLRCTPDVIFDHWSRPLLHGSTPDDVFTSWKQQGIDYLLVLDRRLDEHAYLAPQNNLFLPTLDQWMTPVWSDGKGGYTLYMWK
jgi:hypothetical protein